MLLLLVSIVIITSFMTLDKNFSKDYSNILVLILYIITVLIIAGRYGNSDYFGYFSFYNKMKLESDIGFFKTNHVETFYALLAIFEKIIFGNFVLFLILFTSISIAFKYLIFKKLSPFIFLSILLYSSNFMFKDYIQIRNAMSSGIVLYSLIFITESKILKYYLFNYFAIINHAMAWTAIPLYMLKNIQTRKILLFALILSFIISIAVGNVTNSLGKLLYSQGFYEEKVIGRIVHGSKYGGDANWLSISNILFAFLSFFFIKRFHDFEKISKYAKVLIIAYIYGFCLFLIFHDFKILAGRFFDMYCIPTLCILLPMSLKLYNGFYKTIFLFFIYLYVFYNFTINNGEYILNYESILWHL